MKKRIEKNNLYYKQEKQYSRVGKTLTLKEFQQLFVEPKLNISIGG